MIAKQVCMLIIAAVLLSGANGDDAAGSNGLDSAPLIHVGDKAADCRKLHPYENAWVWTVTTADGTSHVQGIWSDHLDEESVEGKRTLRRVQGMSYVTAKAYVQVNRFDPITCAPTSSEQHGVDGTVNRHTVSGSHVVTERTTKDGHMTTTVFDLPWAPFDFFNGEDGLLLAALPLAVGYSGTLFAIDEIGTKDGSKMAPFKVVREETVRAGSRGNMHTFVVTAQLPGEYTQTFWISERPPYFIRLLVTYPDNRYMYSFDMI